MNLKNSFKLKGFVITILVLLLIIGNNKIVKVQAEEKDIPTWIEYRDQHHGFGFAILN